MQKEIWKDLGIINEKFTGYKVSNLGKVISPYNNQEMHPGISRLGYLNLTIKGHRFSIHRLVGFLFVPGYDEASGKKEINHINGIKTDNRAENLEWSTRSHNVKEAFRMGLKVNKKGSENWHAKEIYQYTLNGVFVRKWGSVTECVDELNKQIQNGSLQVPKGEGNLTTGNLSYACSGKHNSCAGYIWSDHEMQPWELDNKIFLANFNPNGVRVVAIRIPKEEQGKHNGPHYDDIYSRVGNCKIYQDMHKCEEDGFDHSLVAKCIRGERKSHKGYKFFKG